MLYLIVNCIQCLLILQLIQANNLQLNNFVFEEAETEDSSFQHDRLSCHFWRREKENWETHVERYF